MEIPGGHFHHILLYYYRKGKNALQAREKFYDVYGEKLLTERQCQNWFARFRSGDFDLKDAPRSGRPTEVSVDKIKAMIENNRRITTREIAENHGASEMSLHNRHQKPIYIKKDYAECLVEFQRYCLF